MRLAEVFIGRPLQEQEKETKALTLEMYPAPGRLWRCCQGQLAAARAKFALRLFSLPLILPRIRRQKHWLATTLVTLTWNPRCVEYLIVSLSWLAEIV